MLISGNKKPLNKSCGKTNTEEINNQFSDFIYKLNNAYNPEKNNDRVIKWVNDLPTPKDDDLPTSKDDDLPTPKEKKGNGFSGAWNKVAKHLCPGNLQRGILD